MFRYPIHALFGLAIVAMGVSPVYALTLEESLAAAYTTNPQIKAERERLQGTDEGVSQAVSGFRPTLGATYTKGRQRTEFGGAGDSYGDTESKSLRIEQPLFRGGGTWSSYQSALERVKSGQFTLAAVEQNIMLQATAAYMNVLANSAILDLSRKNAAVLEEQLKAATTRFDVGEVTRTDVAQSSARLSDAKTAMLAAEGELQGSIATYERIVGARPEGTLISPERLPELPASLDEALEIGRNANPQLLAAMHEAAASNHDIRTNQAALFPRVSLVGTLSRQDGAGSNGASSFDQDRLAVEVAIPLYQSGAEYSRIREAKALARQRDHETIDRRMTTDETITQSWERLETAVATIATRIEQINAAELALDGVKQEQQYGTRTILDVLDAEQELFSARTNLVRAQRDRIVAGYSLAFALGQLSPTHLELAVAAYNPQPHADAVGWKTIGY